MHVKIHKLDRHQPHQLLCHEFILKNKKIFNNKFPTIINWTMYAITGLGIISLHT